MKFVLASWTLAQRELVRFWRQKSRVMGVVASPLVFWLVVGSGFGDLRTYFPGSLTMLVLFSAIFSSISIIEDRREGFLLSMLVSPAPRLSLVAGKVAGGAFLAWAQGLPFLALGPLVGAIPDSGHAIAAAAALLLCALTMTSLGFLIAWGMDSTQGFHAVMNLVLLPMWLVSGAVFPMETASGWMRVLMMANPMTYCHSLIRSLLFPQIPHSGPQPGLCLVVTVGITAALLAASAWSASRRGAPITA